MTSTDISKKITDVLSELESAFFEIPFENSDYQNLAFVVGTQHTPGRAYRAIGLKMFSKIQAIKETLFSQQLAEVDAEEIMENLDNPNLTKFDKKRMNIQLAKIQTSSKWTEKLLNDSYHELEVLYGLLKQFPKYTREQFEQEEKGHFEAKLALQEIDEAGILESKNGMLTVESLSDFITSHRLAIEKPELLSETLEFEETRLRL